MPAYKLWNPTSLVSKVISKMTKKAEDCFHKKVQGSTCQVETRNKIFSINAIKKKMQVMKVKKNNVCDALDVSEEKMKAPRVQTQKSENKVEELVIKARQLETKLDLTAEKLGIATLQLEEKEKQLAATELEMNVLTRRVSGLEEDLEETEEKMVAAVVKLDKAETAADDSVRAKKVFQSKADEDEKRIIVLKKDLKEAIEKAVSCAGKTARGHYGHYKHYGHYGGPEQLQLIT